jgi:hypothetical protein
MNIQTVLADDELLDLDALAEAMGPEGKPVSRRTVSRLINSPAGLPYIEIAGRKYVRKSVYRDHLLASERRPNPRRSA